MSFVKKVSCRDISYKLLWKEKYEMCMRVQRAVIIAKKETEQ